MPAELGQETRRVTSPRGPGGNQGQEEEEVIHGTHPGRTKPKVLYPPHLNRDKIESNLTAKCTLNARVPREHPPEKLPSELEINVSVGHPCNASPQTYQVGAHFKGLDEGIFMVTSDCR